MLRFIAFASVITIAFFVMLPASARAQEAAKSAAPAPMAARSVTVELKTPTGTLHGTLLLPAADAQPVPVVLLHAGSGPTDRDGNSPLLPGANNSLKMLAEGLAQNGIATLRFDKRGVAQSVSAATREEDLRFDTYIADTVAWGKWLKADKRFTKLIIAGHSEGSLIGMVAARQIPAQGFISIAGVGRPAQEVLLAQLRAGLPAAPLKEAEGIVARLVAGKTVGNVSPDLAVLFRPSVQPYLLSWFRYNSAKEIAKLRIPVLIVQGTNDVQIKMDEAQLLSKAKPDAKLVVISEMNHTLKTVPMGDNAAQQRAYTDPTVAVTPELIKAITDFVKK